MKSISLLPTIEGEHWPIDEINDDQQQLIDDVSDAENTVVDKEVIGSVNDDKKVEIELDVNPEANSDASNDENTDGQINLF